MVKSNKYYYFFPSFKVSKDHLNQSKISKISGVSQSTVSRVLAGKIIKSETVDKVARGIKLFIKNRPAIIELDQNEKLKNFTQSTTNI